MCLFNEAIRDISDIVSGPSGDLRGTGKCSAGRGGGGGERCRVAHMFVRTSRNDQLYKGKNKSSPF